MLALAATSRSSRELTAPLIYRYLKFKVSTPAKLADDVKELGTPRVGSLYLQHARHIMLKGCMSLEERGEFKMRDYHDLNDDDDDDGEQQNNVKPFQPGTNFALEEPLYVPFSRTFSVDGPKNDRDADTAAWQPFVSLLGSFQRLNDLIWDCRGRFPPALLDTLVQYHPHCRLHARKFRFLSLHEPATDPDELALVNSPNLYSLSSVVVYRDSSGKDDFNIEAARRTITAAPNLKHFRLLGASPASSPYLARARGIPRKVWAGFQPSPPRNEKASLESFSTIGDQETISLTELNLWSARVDLRSLKKAAFTVVDPNVLTRLFTDDLLSSLQGMSPSIVTILD